MSVLGRTTYVGADPGLAALYELSPLTGMYGMVTGLMGAYALIRTGGIGAGEFAELLVPWVTAMLGSAPGWAKAIDAGRHATAVSSIAVDQAGFANLLNTFAAQGLSTELLTA